ncbi:BZ3500_MvSof-1268-A1-R1_Chr1-3g01956 [Microbotryum saponariae]|uniref:BZ3500_MvSof-1268-A1-R1_Chr1-3g01956 protein n=1 Tax=Microbotryum saponariae TaxID=289078 RepID=A0A2X0MSN3_9BASI|nr:BZ3500_MvSof-1268-A1-R1_Chr1-3g01956 [Microbotryum saponariae]SCZ95005.1 BZ3501_MvSof-1269-A2-R1_Chr1-3g01558 [Microbotryum saponariae]
MAARDKPIPVELLDAKSSQRQTTTCSECSRRKTRWYVPGRRSDVNGSDDGRRDKKSPCSPCVKRGKAHICRIPGHLQSAQTAQAAASPAESSIYDLDLLAFTAFREVEQVRTTIDGLKNRVACLETLLLQAFGKLKDARKDGTMRDDLDIGPLTSGFREGEDELRVDSTSSTSKRAPWPGSAPQHESPRPNGDKEYHGVPLKPSTSSSQENELREREEDEDEDELGEDLSELREEEVAASLSLEFMEDTVISISSPSHPQGFDPTCLPRNPVDVFPTIRSLAGVIPPGNDTMAILRHSLEWMGWYHGVVFGPGFMNEVAQFWEAGDQRVEVTHPAWLALFFAQLRCGVRHMTGELLSTLGTDGLSETDAKQLSETLLVASLAALYHSNFIEVPHLYAVQTIALLVITCQDGGSTALFPTLLNVGIAIAQGLGLHRLPSRVAWEANHSALQPADRAKRLIEYETNKRIWWALASQDWFNISYRRTTTAQPSQMTTPLPLNVRDQDLSSGNLIERPVDEFTPASNGLVFVRLASLIQAMFAHIDDSAKMSYDYVLELDRDMQSIIDHPPAWVHNDILPWARNAFYIGSLHKILALHRPFLHRAVRERRFEKSRVRALETSRAILRESLNCGDTRLWTLPYHIGSAASFVCLDLFQRGSDKATLKEERREVRQALEVLRGMRSLSATASRAVDLVEDLLTEESRLQDNASPRPSAHSGTSTLKRKRDTHQGGSNHRQGSLKRLDATTPSPAITSSLTGASPQQSPHSMYHPFSPPQSTQPPPHGVFDPTVGPLPYPGPLLDLDMMAGLNFGAASRDALPAEYLNVFLGSGFDPLDLMGQTWSAAATPAAVANNSGQGLDPARANYVTE